MARRKTTELRLYILDPERFPDQAAVRAFLWSDDFDHCLGAIESALMPGDEAPEAVARAALPAAWSLAHDLRMLHSIATYVGALKIEHKPTIEPVSRAVLAVNAGIDQHPEAAAFLIGMVTKDEERRIERALAAWKAQEATE